MNSNSNLFFVVIFFVMFFSLHHSSEKHISDPNNISPQKHTWPKVVYSNRISPEKKVFSNHIFSPKVVYSNKISPEKNVSSKHIFSNKISPKPIETEFMFVENNSNHPLDQILKKNVIFFTLIPYLNRNEIKKFYLSLTKFQRKFVIKNHFLDDLDFNIFDTNLKKEKFVNLVKLNIPNSEHLGGIILSKLNSTNSNIDFVPIQILTKDQTLNLLSEEQGTKILAMTNLKKISTFTEWNATFVSNEKFFYIHFEEIIFVISKFYDKISILVNYTEAFRNSHDSFKIFVNPTLFPQDFDLPFSIPEDLSILFDENFLKSKTETFILKSLHIYGKFFEKLGVEFGSKKVFIFYIMSAPYIFSLYQVSDFTDTFDFGWRIFLITFFSLFNPVAHLFTALYLGHYGAIKKSKEIFLFSNNAWVIPFIQNPNSLKTIKNTILRFTFLTICSYLFQLFTTVKGQGFFSIVFQVFLLLGYASLNLTFMG